MAKSLRGNLRWTRILPWWTRLPVASYHRNRQLRNQPNDLLYQFCLYLECEHLIRHMLVRDVAKRYTMVQIINHKWLNEMTEEDKASALATDTIPDSELTEEVLTIMQSRGIDREKTIQVLILFLYFLKFYCLLRALFVVIVKLFKFHNDEISSVVLMDDDEARRAF